MKLQRQHFLRMVILTILLLSSFTSVSAEQFIGNITLKQGERLRLNLSSAYQDIMTRYGRGYPYSWWSENTNICTATSYRTKTYCEIYANGIGTTQIHYTGEYYSGGVIYEYTCYWFINVEAGEGGSGGGTTPSSNDEYTLPEESWGDFGNYDFSWYNKNQTEFTISTNKELAGMAYLVNNQYANFEGKRIYLSSDIDISGRKWTSFGSNSFPFKGTLDGQGHSIFGMSSEKGFISEMIGATITNLTLQGYVYSNGGDIGGLAGYAGACILEKCGCDVIIIINQDHKGYDSYIGGLVGRSWLDYSNGWKPTCISYCTFDGEVKCKMKGDPIYIGGIVGTSNSTKIEYCENNASMISVESEGYPSIGEHQPIRVCGIEGYGVSFKESEITCCRSICSYTVKHHASADRYYPNIGICGVGGKSVNSFSVIPSITISATTSCSPNYYGIGEKQVKANYSNSDVNIQTTLNVKQSNSGSTAFSSAQMQTPAFLQELNMYPMFEMDGPVWTQDVGSYPYIAKLHEVSGISSVYIDKKSDTNIYTLSGQRLTSPKKGINIVGGKKVIVR